MGSILLLVIFFFGILKDRNQLKRLIIVFVITIVTFFSLLNAKENQGKYYSAFWVEGIPIFWLLLVLLT